MALHRRGGCDGERVDEIDVEDGDLRSRTETLVHGRCHCGRWPGLRVGLCPGRGVVVHERGVWRERVGCVSSDPRSGRICQGRDPGLGSAPFVGGQSDPPRVRGNFGFGSSV